MENQRILSPTDFPNICRICLGRNYLTGIQEIRFIVNLFRSLAHIHIQELDDLPQNICTDCIGQIEDLSKFINKSKQTDVLLKKILNKVQTDNTEETMETPVQINIKVEPDTAMQYENETSEDENNTSLIKPETENETLEALGGFEFDQSGVEMVQNQVNQKYPRKEEWGFHTPHQEEESSNNLHLLPPKSKKIYMNTYKEFLDWCEGNNIGTYSEKVFLAYFTEKSNSCKPSTLWSHYSMLKATFKMNMNIDLSRFKTLLKFLKQASEHYKPAKSKLLTKEEFDRFIEEAPDSTFLMMKVCVMFGIAGACNRSELSEIRMEDIQDAGNALVVSLRDNKDNKITRTFTIVDTECRKRSLLDVYRQYVALRSPVTAHGRFFVFYRNLKCTRQPVGVNQIGKIPSMIAKYLNLTNPEMYTGHCFRRSAASVQPSLAGYMTDGKGRPITTQQICKRNSSS